MTRFFDANFWLAEPHYWLSSSLYGEAEKRAEIRSIKRSLEANGISHAIVTHKLALGYDWNIGNEKLLSTHLCQEVENLYYAYVLAPDVSWTYDFDTYLETAFRNKVRLFRFFPKNHFFYLNDAYTKKIFRSLSEKKLPIMLDLKQLDITGNKYFDIDVLERVLDENKDMPVILEASLKQCMFSRYFFCIACLIILVKSLSIMKYTFLLPGFLILCTIPVSASIFRSVETAAML